MNQLEKIFNYVNMQLKEEKTKYKKLKFVNTVSKLVIYVYYH